MLAHALHWRRELIELMHRMGLARYLQSGAACPHKIPTRQLQVLMQHIANIPLQGITAHSRKQTNSFTHCRLGGDLLGDCTSVTTDHRPQTGSQEQTCHTAPTAPTVAGLPLRLGRSSSMMCMSSVGPADLTQLVITVPAFNCSQATMQACFLQPPGTGPGPVAIFYTHQRTLPASCSAQEDA
jgi:hypothetical protein